MTKRTYKLSILVTLTVTSIFCQNAVAGNWATIQKRLNNAARDKQPIIIHVTVALCDNQYEGIVPVPAALGNGQDARNNLYWGAAYGVASFFKNKTDWKEVAHPKNRTPEILETRILKKDFQRGETAVPVYLIAEAWDGKAIRQAMQSFLMASAGQGKSSAYTITQGDTNTTLHGGKEAHLLAYVGHNGLMDFEIPLTSPAENRTTKSIMALACASKPYLESRLKVHQNHATLLTTGLMAPEAYTLNAAINAWLMGKSPNSVREAAATAYHQYQKCGMKGARRLFYTEGAE